MVLPILDPNLKISHNCISCLVPLLKLFSPVQLSCFFNLLQNLTLTACASGRGQLILGDSEGTLYCINRHLELMSFKAYELNVSHLFQLKQHNILVSVGVSTYAKSTKVNSM